MKVFHFHMGERPGDRVAVVIGRVVQQPEPAKPPHHDHLVDSVGKHVVDRIALGHVPDTQRSSRRALRLDGPSQRLEASKNGTEHRGLARAIRPDDTEVVSGLDGETYIVQHDFAAIPKPGLLERNDHRSALITVERERRTVLMAGSP